MKFKEEIIGDCRLSRPFSFHVARLAKPNQVAQVISFLNSFKFSKRNDVVDGQRLANVFVAMGAIAVLFRYHNSSNANPSLPPVSRYSTNVTDRFISDKNSRFTKTNMATKPRRAVLFCNPILLVKDGLAMLTTAFDAVSPRRAFFPRKPFLESVSWSLSNAKFVSNHVFLGACIKRFTRPQFPRARKGTKPRFRSAIWLDGISFRTFLASHLNRHLNPIMARCFGLMEISTTGIAKQEAML